MNKFLSSAFLLISFVILFSACTKTSEQSAVREKIFLDDGTGGKNEGEVEIEQSSVKDAETQISFSQEFHQNSDETESGGTQVSTMYDGFGNKIERRFFFQHPLLKAMVLRTSTNGQREVLIFGHNGEVKTVPQNMVDKAMTATADELAKSAGITMGRKPTFSSFSDLSEEQKDTIPLSPTAPDFNIQNAAPENAKTETAEKQKPEKPKTASQDVKLAELQYQTELNKINLKSKKSQAAKNGQNREW